MQYHNGRINETQIEKAVDQKVIEKQMVNSIESPTISNNDVEPLPHEIEQQKKLQKKKVIEDSFPKKEDALIGLKTKQFSSENKNALDNVQNAEKDLVMIFKRKSISDLEIKP